MLIAEIAINVPLDNNFYYRIPEELKVKILQRVSVNFGGRETIGYIIKIIDEKDVKEKLAGIKIKDILKIIDDDPILNEEVIETAQWISRFYVSPFSEALFAISPSAKNPKKYSHPYSFTGKLAELNVEQLLAYNEIEKFLGKPETFLIHGITGSGKTEIYKHLVKKALDLGKSSIILIPEIALTPQNLERFYESFGDEVSIYHSKLTQNEKLGEWLKALKGKSHVVIGPRSAVFSPVENLGLIVIDEEHADSYKSNNSPRYHARQVAYRRAKTLGATLVLGSATPQIETYYYSLKKEIHLIELKNRYGNIKLPSVKIIDMKDKAEEKSLISIELLKDMMETLKSKKQVLLFLNRRGFSPVLICKDCGYVFNCPNCNVSLNYHKTLGKIICHHCGHAQNHPDICPSCGNSDISELGSGTEKLESMVESFFPNYRIERMDLDTTRKRNSHLEILGKIKNREADIIIGTQMVAKGHDIAGIQLVGVILPDIILNIPDFRSMERTFILLTQVIGRAGRRDVQGEAIIQTYLPDHYSITTAAKQDYSEFFRIEIEKRRLFNYPPFKRIGRLVIRGENQGKVIEFVQKLKEYINNTIKLSPGTQILGPVSCPIEKLKNNYRYHIIIKSNYINEINKDIRVIKEFFKISSFSRHLYLEIDIDPVSLV